MSGFALPDPRSTPFVDVETAGKLCGLGRSKAYAQARRFITTGGLEGLPAVAFGRSLRVPVAALYRIAGLPLPGDHDSERESAPAPTGADVVALPVAASARGASGGT